MSSAAPWPPKVRELLPRGSHAVGVRHKLATYVLNSSHLSGAHKARGFERLLGITANDIDYLEDEITAGILHEPISSVRHNPPYGVNCVVEIPVRGRGSKHHRTANVRTVWEFTGVDSAPRLVSAYIKV
jgi:hypothetical protein